MVISSISSSESERRRPLASLGSQNSPLHISSILVLVRRKPFLELLQGVEGGGGGGAGARLPFNDGILNRDLAVIKVVTDVESHPLRIVLVHRERFVSVDCCMKS